MSSLNLNLERSVNTKAKEINKNYINSPLSSKSTSQKEWQKKQDSRLQAIEKAFMFFAIFTFFLHLGAIMLAKADVIFSPELASQSLLSAVVTPFSVVLMYEIVELIFSFRDSTLISVGKQYKIILLVLIRNIFKEVGDFGNTELNFEILLDFLLPVAIDTIAALIIFVLLIRYYHYIRLVHKKDKKEGIVEEEIPGLMKIKGAMVYITAFVGVVLLIMHFEPYYSDPSIEKLFETLRFKEFISNIFTFFIILDVLLILISFIYNRFFHQIFRNSLLVVSTILIRVAVGTEELIIGAIFALTGVILGVATVWLYVREKSEEIG